MSTVSPRPLHPTLLPSLNALLAALSLPFALDHPTDLTPSLLLAIFESIINARLPIPNSVRQSRTRDAKSRAMLVLLGVLECDVLRGGTAAADADGDLSAAASNANDSALSAAGGVSVDGWIDEIGLGQVDPEQLADGGWEETIFVGELLCWLARRRGILPRIRSSRMSSRPRSLYSNHHSYGTEEGEGEGDTVELSTSLLLRPSSAQTSRSPQAPSPSPPICEASVDADFSTFSHISDVPRHPLVHSPELSLSASATTHTDLSIRARSISSRTSVSNTHDDLDHFDGASQDTLEMYNPARMMQDAEEDDDQPPSFRPQCIHELEDPSYIRALAGPSSSFGHSVSHEPDSVVEEADPSRDEYDDPDEQDNDDLYAPPTPTPRRVRLTGWIDPVDAATELSSFIASRTRTRAFPTSGPPSQSHYFKHVQAGETSKSTTSRLGANMSPPSRLERLGKFYTPRHASPSPSRSPSPSPPLLIPSPKHLARRLSPSPPPSPPSPPTHSDPPFDISFSKPNNTSTPAKPRPPRRHQFKPATRQELENEPHLGVDVRKSGGSLGNAAARPVSHRSPSYTPSPPSFSTPSSLRSGGGTRSGSTASSGTKAHLGISASSASFAQSSAMATGAITNNKRGSASSTPTTMPLLSSAKGKSPPPNPPLPGSTTTTNALLTERARLLTELAALKRVRAAANGAGVARTGSGTGVGNGGGIVGHRVGVGV